MVRAIRLATASLISLTILGLCAGCENRPAPPAAAVDSTAPGNDGKLSLNDVPAPILEKAREARPGVEFQWATKTEEGSQVVYKLQGRSDEGKVHEVDVNAVGEVLKTPGETAKTPE